MQRRTLTLAVMFLTLLALPPAQAAGPMGHYILARKLISNFQSGGFQAPAELKMVLKDPDCQRAYCGGAIGPDLCEGKSHYGATADLVRNMLLDARANMKAAAAKRDAKAFASAKQELAFAYGWISHLVIDMNVHQLVNGMQGIGDTYRFTSDSQKVMHGAYESQLTAYLRQTIWNPKDKYDVLIPYAFVASVVGVSDASVRQMSGVIKGKVALELVESGNCDVSRDQLASIWNKVTTDSLQEVAKFTNAPEAMKNWDIDVGHIGTGNFEKMRKIVLDVNDGKVTPDWGKKYPEYWDAIKDLRVSEWRAKLMELLGKQEKMPTNYQILITMNPDPKAEGRDKMPGDWSEPYISTWVDADLGAGTSFTFSKTIDDSIGHMKRKLNGSGSISPKGEVSIEASWTGGQTYISHYGNGPEIRFVQDDKASFTESGTIEIKRWEDGAVGEIKFTQTRFDGKFVSSMSLTELDDKGNDKSTETTTCSGGFVPKSSGLDVIKVPK